MLGIHGFFKGTLALVCSLNILIHEVESLGIFYDPPRSERTNQKPRSCPVDLFTFDSPVGLMGAASRLMMRRALVGVRPFAISITFSN